MKRYFVVITMLFTISALFAAPAFTAEVTLPEAVEKSLQRTAGYQNRLLDQKVRELETQTAGMNKYFTAAAGGSYMYRSEQMEISLPGQTMKAGAKHNYDLNLSLIQPLFTGFKLTQAVKMSELREAMNRNQTLLEKIRTAAAVKNSYFNYRLLANKKKSLNILLHRLNLHRERLEKFYNEELVRKTDLLETRRKISELELNIETADNGILSEKIRFQRLCGLDIESVKPGYNESAGSYEEAFGAFKTSHPVLKTLGDRLAVLSVNTNIVKGDYLPQVAGFAELHYGRPGVDFFQNQWQLYFQGGVRVSMKLFDWNKRKRSLSALDYAAEKVKNERDDFIRDAEQGLRQLYQARQSLRRRMTIMGDLLAAAEEDAHLKAELYKEQQVPNIDYLEALTVKERYDSMKDELAVQLQLIHVRINQLTGKI